MLIKNTIKIIDKAIVELEYYIKKYNIPNNSSLSSGHIFVLKLLKNEMLQNKMKINTRVLRAFKDISTSTAIQYEESNFHDSIFEIFEILEKNIREFTSLELLRMDFGKGNPI